MKIENIVVDNMEEIKKSFKNFFVIFFDIVILLVVFSVSFYNESRYIENPIIFIGLLGFIYIRNGRYLTPNKQVKFSELALRHAEVFSKSFVLIYFLSLLNSNKIDHASYLVVGFTCLSLFVFFIQSLERGFSLLHFNQIINISFITSFFLMLNNGYFDLQKALFGTEQNLIHDRSDKLLGIYFIHMFLSITLLSAFMLSKDWFVKYAKSVIILSLIYGIVMINIHIFNDVKNINYELIKSYLILIFCFITMINLMIELEKENLARILGITLFKVFIIFCTFNIIYFKFPNELVIGLTSFLALLFAFKKPFDNDIKIFIFILGISVILAVGNDLFYKQENNIAIVADYSIWFIMGSILGVSLTPSTNNNQSSNSIIFSLLKLKNGLFSADIHESIKLRNEVLKKRVFYCPVEKIKLILKASIPMQLLFFFCTFCISFLIAIISSSNYLPIEFAQIAHRIIYFSLASCLMSFLAFTIISSSFYYITSRRIYYKALLAAKSYEYAELNIHLINDINYVYYKNNRILKLVSKSEEEVYILGKIKEAKKNKKGK